jgi:hypothetical protein
MRALTWISAGLLSITGASGCLFAQDTAKAETRDQGPPLSIHLLPSDGGYLQYELNDPAYVAAFEVYSGGAAELLYPVASREYREAVGMHVQALTYLATELEQRQALLALYALQASWACVFVVASRQPLHLEQYATHPLALSASLGYHSVSMTNPEAGLAPVLAPARPSSANDWASDELCGPVGGLTGGHFAERPFVPIYQETVSTAATNMIGYSSRQPIGPFKLSVCVVRRGDASGSCGSSVKLPFKPASNTAGTVKDRPVVMKPDAKTGITTPVLRIGTREDRPPSAVPRPNVRAADSRSAAANTSNPPARTSARRVVEPRRVEDPRRAAGLPRAPSGPADRLAGTHAGVEVVPPAATRPAPAARVAIRAVAIPAAATAALEAVAAVGVIAAEAPRNTKSL